MSEVGSTALAAAGQIAMRLAEPNLPDETERRFAQSLAKGAAGIALLHIERAMQGCGTWRTAHRWVTAATAYDISAADEAALFIGAPSIAFVLHAACADGTTRYAEAAAKLDARITGLAHRRIDAALTRIDRGEPPQFAEYDLFYGLTGIGALLLHHHPRSDALGRILAYLVRLTTEPLQRADGRLPGWWVDHDPDLLAPTPGGHANFGIAHGVSGPLALLALAMRTGITVDGHLDAIQYICAWLDDWRQDNEAGPWWPQWIVAGEIRTGRVAHQGSPRPSWCYGTPGIARAQQLAAIATGDTTRQGKAERALAASIAAPSQLAMISDAGLCHGIAGVYQTAWRAARDAMTPDIGHLLPMLTEALHARTDSAAQNSADLLDGAAGLALALHTAAHDAPPISGWDACILIA